MDETHAPSSGAAELVCLKISRGGISAVLEDARAARTAGSSVYLDVDVRRAAGDRRRRPHRRGAADLAPLRAGHARQLRRGDGSTGAARRIDRGAFHSGPRMT